MTQTSMGKKSPILALKSIWLKIITCCLGMIFLAALSGCSLQSGPTQFEQEPPPVEKAQVVFAVNTWFVKLKEGE